MRSGQAAEPKARLLLGWRQAGCSQSGYREGGGSLFTSYYMEKVRGGGYKSLLGRFPLVTGRKFSSMGLWNNLPREVVESLALDS